MYTIKLVTYEESREEFFKRKLKIAKSNLDRAVKNKASHDECSEKGYIVSYYEDAIKAFKVKE